MNTRWYAERALVASLLRVPDMVRDQDRWPAHEVIQDARLGDLYRRVLLMIEEGSAPTQNTGADDDAAMDRYAAAWSRVLTARFGPDPITRATTLAGIMAMAPVPAHALSYARIVVEAHVIRTIGAYAHALLADHQRTGGQERPQVPWDQIARTLSQVEHLGRQWADLAPTPPATTPGTPTDHLAAAGAPGDGPGDAMTRRRAIEDHFIGAALRQAARGEFRMWSRVTPAMFVVPGRAGVYRIMHTLHGGSNDRITLKVVLREAYNSGVIRSPDGARWLQEIHDRAALPTKLLYPHLSGIGQRRILEDRLLASLCTSRADHPVATVLRPGDFITPGRDRLYSVLAERLHTGQPVDPVILLAEAQHIGLLGTEEFPSAEKFIAAFAGGDADSITADTASLLALSAETAFVVALSTIAMNSRDLTMTADALTLTARTHMRELTAGHRDRALAPGTPEGQYAPPDESDAVGSGARQSSVSR